jgi:hypothetical protein
MFPYFPDPATAKTLAAMCTPEQIAAARQRSLAAARQRDLVRLAAQERRAARRSRTAAAIDADSDDPAVRRHRRFSWMPSLARRVVPSPPRRAPIEPGAMPVSGQVALTRRRPPG